MGPPVPDLLTVDLPSTGRAMVVSDLHLPASVTPAATDARVPNMNPPMVGVAPATDSQRRTVADE